MLGNVTELCADEFGELPVRNIPEAAFPKPGALPPIREGEDGEAIVLPPDDLPDEATPKEK